MLYTLCHKEKLILLTRHGGSFRIHTKNIYTIKGEWTTPILIAHYIT